MDMVPTFLPPMITIEPQENPTIVISPTGSPDRVPLSRKPSMSVKKGFPVKIFIEEPI
jgi:hypothetical protein